MKYNELGTNEKRAFNNEVTRIASDIVSFLEVATRGHRVLSIPALVRCLAAFVSAQDEEEGKECAQLICELLCSEVERMK
jgi:hypothetical protein